MSQFKIDNFEDVRLFVTKALKMHAKSGNSNRDNVLPVNWQDFSYLNKVSLQFLD